MLYPVAQFSVPASWLPEAQYQRGDGDYTARTEQLTAQRFSPRWALLMSDGHALATVGLRYRGA